MSLKNRRGVRPGFTLPEVLVTIALVAALAAVVVPTIASQLTKGDPSRVGSDYGAIRGAVEQFLSDVRKYPRNIQQLTTSITAGGTSATSTALTAVGTTYTTADVARWRGPYLSKDSTSAATTGFGYSVVLDTATLTSTSGAFATNYVCVSACTGTRYLLMRVSAATGVAADTADWLTLDKTLDDGIALQGSIRYQSTGNGIKLILLPIQP